MLSAGERLVLAKCHELSGQGFGFVPDSELSIHTQVTLELVRDYLRGLDSEQLVELVPLEGGGFTASVTARGRQELAKFEQIAATRATLVAKPAITLIPTWHGWSPSYVRLILGLFLLVSPVIIYEVGGPLSPRLEPLRRWGNVSPVYTTLLPSLGGTALGALFLLTNRSKATKAIVLLASLVVACVSPVAYNVFSNTPPTSGNNSYYDAICFLLIILSSFSPGLFVSSCIAVVLRPVTEEDRKLPTDTCLRDEL
jgi:hypothetical protein